VRLRDREREWCWWGWLWWWRRRWRQRHRPNKPLYESRVTLYRCREWSLIGWSSRDGLSSRMFVNHNNTELENETGILRLYVSYDKLWVTMMDTGWWDILCTPLTCWPNCTGNSSLRSKQREHCQNGLVTSVKKGVRQGCILSPYLFHILAEMVMRETLDGFQGGLQTGERKTGEWSRTFATLITSSCWPLRRQNYRSWWIA